MASPGSDKIFSLASQSLKLTTVEDCHPHLEPLISSDSITEIRLNGNTLGVAASTHIASILANKSQLQTANLADIFTARLLSEIPPSLSALLTALLNCSNLHTVDLSDNAFGLNTVAPLVAFLKEHVPLRHLILNNNGLGPAAGVLIADALFELAEKKDAARQAGREVPRLETIVCGRNRLEAGSMEAWSKALARHGNVKSIRMVQNGIRPDGIVTLLREGLGKCAGLEVVDLQDNTFTMKGGQALAKVLEEWSELRELGIGEVLLGARGVVLVAEALGKGKNKGLRILKTQFNDANVKGLAALVTAVEKGGLEELRRVELNGNKFSEDEEGVLRLRELLEERRAKASGEEGEEWGLDELDEMESDEEEDEEDEEVEEEEEERIEIEEKAERLLEETDQAEQSNVAERKDKSVDDLADVLGKTSI